MKTKKTNITLTLEQEETLVKKIKQQPAAFNLLYDQYYPLIFNYVYKRTLDFDLTKDICSEVFLKAFLKINQFRWKGVSIAAWFYRIATNEINLSYRRKKYKPSSMDDLLGEVKLELPDPASLQEEKDAIERQMQEHEDFLLIQSKLKLLPLKYQEVIALRYFEQKSIQEISQILKKKSGTIKSLISRGLEKIRQMI